MKIDEPLIGKAGQDTDLTKKVGELWSDSHEDNVSVDAPLAFNIPRPSDWQVELWGNNGFVVRPAYGDEPNRWIRFWMRVFFNSKWSKV